MKELSSVPKKLPPIQPLQPLNPRVPEEPIDSSSLSYAPPEPVKEFSQKYRYEYSRRNYPRTKGTVIQIMGSCAEQTVIIKEDVTGINYSWDVWELPYGFISGEPLALGDRVSFEVKDKKKLLAQYLLMLNGDPPGVNGDAIWH